VLQRHVDVLDQRIVSSNRVQQPLRYTIGIRIQEPDPFRQLSGNFRQTREQVGETMLHPEIFAVTGRILSDQIQFSHTHRKHARRFVDYALETAAAELTSELRNHTKRAGVITAFRDLYIGGMLRRGENTRREVVVQIRLGLVFDRG